MNPIHFASRDDASLVPLDEVEFLASLSGPTLFRFEGRDRSRTRAFIALLHGNEPSSFRALHRLLLQGTRPAVNLVCFVGAVEAAREAPLFSHRMLPGRRDLNRCFRSPFAGLDGQIARALLDELQRLEPEAIVDLHNNTGHNPAYGIGTFPSKRHLALASLFADRYVLSNLRLGALMEAFDDRSTVISVECGRAGDPRADEIAIEGIERFVRAERLSEAPGRPLFLYAHPRRVTLKAGLRIAFDEAPHAKADVTLNHDVDRHNFTRLDAGVRIGWAPRCVDSPLEVRDHSGIDVTREYFAVDHGEIVTRRACTPIMMTTHVRAVADDCLFYLVAEMDPHRD